jgi:hypothetical protein
MSDVVNLTFIKRFTIAAVKIINLITESKLFTKFVKYINVFDIKKAGVLPTYNKNEYTINLNGNELFFGLLYNLLTKELKVLRMYFNVILAKK